MERLPLRDALRLSLAENDNETNPTVDLIDQLNRWSEERHAWLSRAAAQIAEWKAEDAAAGHPWGDDE